MTDPRDATRRVRGATDDVTASEVGTYVFCAKAWHLEHVLGKRPSAVATRRRTVGVAEHDTHGARVVALQRSGPRLARWVAALLVLAAVLLALGIFARGR